ncbi:(Fe-S)-binding protein [bacterium]|nr:(Fe-S)-binding protein [bacterium]
MEVKYLKDWETEMNTCIRCAYCFEGCPMFKEKGWESDTPRGKVVLAYGLFTGQLEPSDYIAEKILECTFCRDCIQRCSANISVPDILTAARADLVEAGFKYDSHVNLLNKVESSGNIFGKELKAPPHPGKTPVLLGCRFLERSDDAKRYVEILTKLGMEPMTVEDEVCCGMPPGVLGYKDKTNKQKALFRERFPYNEFICMCTTCVFFIRKSYTDLNPTYIIEEIYKRLPEANPRQLGLTVTYHDPCNVGRGMDMVKEPRKILKMIGCDYVEMETFGKEAECCGGGGGVLVTDRELSEKLARKRYRQALDTGAKILVTLCPTCELNLANMAKEDGNKIEVKNLLDLIWEALR